MRPKKRTRSEVLEEALRKSFSEYHRQFPDSEGEVLFGQDYDDYMNGLIRRSKHSSLRTGQRYAASIAAVVLIALICTMTVSAVRVPVVSFMTNIFENYTEMFFHKDDVANASETIETAYTLGFVPEGYELTSRSGSVYSLSSVWLNKSSGVIEFRQSTLIGKITVDNEKTDNFYYEIDGLQIIYNEKNGENVYFWNTDEYQFCLSIKDDTVSKEQGLDIIRSVREY